MQLPILGTPSRLATCLRKYRCAALIQGTTNDRGTKGRRMMHRLLLAPLASLALLAPYAYASDPASPELVAATANAPMDPEEQLDEGLKSFGYLTGLALGCVVAEQRVALETEAIELHAAIARLLGTDRAFLYSSAFGYGPRSRPMPGTARKSSTATTCVSPGFARVAGAANEHACNSVGSGRRDQGGERRLTNRDRAHTGQCRSPCRPSQPGLRYVPAQILKVQCAANLPRGETTPS